MNKIIKQNLMNINIRYICTDIKIDSKATIVKIDWTRGEAGRKNIYECRPC